MLKGLLSYIPSYREALESNLAKEKEIRTLKHELANLRQMQLLMSDSELYSLRKKNER